MERISNTKRKKKFKVSKKKLTILIVVVAIFIGIFFFINRLIPIKNINEDNISINLSTIKPTGKNITAKISTKTNYDIFYFIDYSVAEENYYEDEELSEDIEEISEFRDTQNVTNSTNTSISEESSNSVNNVVDSSKNTNKSIEIKQISDKEYQKIDNSKIEIENNGVVYLKYGRFGKLSSTPYVFQVSNIDKDGPEIGDISTTSTYTSINVVVNVIDKNEENMEYYFRLASSNTYISTGSRNSYTFKDLTTDESYIIYVKVIDQFGNESEAVTEATASVEDENEVVVQKLYHFKVNLGANTVTVYEKDDNGKFTKPVKAFICSTGKSTPKSGTYKISNKYRWRSLFGGVYGQYAVRIYGNILFHSVPYEKMYANTLEYEEYDKLGTSASMGCIRLCVRDAKWIYDNAKAGSTVEFYSDASNPGPLGKPKSQKISSNKANRNWDPTDPDKHNPWLGGDGKVTKTTIVDDNDINSNTISNTVSNANTTNTTNSVKNENTNSTAVPKNETIYTPPVNEENDNPPVENTTQTPSPQTNTTTEPPPEPPPIQNTTTPTPDTGNDETNTNTTTDPTPSTPPVEAEPTPPVSNTIDEIEIGS